MKTEINKKIEKLREEIARLEEQKQQEESKNYSNYIGRCFKPAYSTFIKIKSVESSYTDEEEYAYLEVNCIMVCIDDTRVRIENNYFMGIELDKNEISQEEFYNKLEEGIQLIKSTVNNTK